MSQNHTKQKKELRMQILLNVAFMFHPEKIQMLQQLKDSSDKYPVDNRRAMAQIDGYLQERGGPLNPLWTFLCCKYQSVTYQ